MTTVSVGEIIDCFIGYKLDRAPRPWSVSVDTRPHTCQTVIYINDANGHHVAECFIEDEAEVIVAIINAIVP